MLNYLYFSSGRQIGLIVKIIWILLFENGQILGLDHHNKILKKIVII